VVAESVPVERFQTEVPEGGVLAVIRYPAIVEKEAQDIFHRAYAKRSIGGQVGRGVTNTIETVAIADASVVKSNYFALSLYKELAAKLPEHSVLLSPHAIKLGSGGELTSEPITAAENLPSVVSVDFATYSFPDTRRMLENVPLTFGDLVTPLVTVRTDHRASAPNQGVLLASRPLISRAAAEGREAALQTIDALQRGDLAPVTPELDFISYITNDTPQRVAVQELATRSDTNSTMVLPVEKVRISPEDMYLLSGASDGSVDPLDDIYTDALSSRIVALINGLDAEKAVMMGRAASIAEFDPSLAALTFIGSDDEDYLSRSAQATRLLEAERRYLSVQSLRIFDGIHNGTLGEQVRDMISAEQDVLNARRILSGQQNIATAGAVAGVGGGGIVGTSGASSDASRRARTAVASLLTQIGIFAATEAYSKAQLSQQVGINYLNAIVPALEQQTTVTVDLLESNETITAIRYEDLQAKLQGVYNENQRALDTVATQCAYVRPGGQKRGTWLGVCKDGLAHGPGVGVLKRSDDVMEYYGYAENGLAEGAGLMIRHSTLGSISYEGHFVKGVPDGVVRVSQSGREDQIRNFVKGIDKGASEQNIVTPFGKNYSAGIN